jgi:hypothetical protein
MKFTKDDNMKCLVVEYANGSFYGFNLVDKNERHDATNIVVDVDNDFTIIGWRMSKKSHHGLYPIRNGKAMSCLVKFIMTGTVKLLLLARKAINLMKNHSS